MKNSKALLFDLGGVLIDVDYHRTINAFTALGFENAQQLYNQFDQNQLFDRYEKGEVSSGYFIDQLKPLSRIEVSTGQVVDAWNAMIGEFPIEKLNFINDLKQGIPCYLLSNTNEIHLKKAMEALKKTPYPELDPLFKTCYYSHLIGKRKPDAETFRWVIDQMGFQAQNVLFIDDSPQHIEGAIQAGLKTKFYQKKEDLFELIKEI